MFQLGQEVFRDAFFQLSSTRINAGFGLGEISWLSIQEYCDRMGFSDSLRRDMLHYIPQMDVAYLQYMAKKQKNANPS